MNKSDFVGVANTLRKLGVIGMEDYVRIVCFAYEDQWRI